MSNHHMKPLAYYYMGSARDWLRLAVATVDEAAAALCRNRWQLARVKVAAYDSQPTTGRGRVHINGPIDCRPIPRDPVLH